MVYLDRLLKQLNSKVSSPLRMGTAEPFSCNVFQRAMKMRLCWVAPTGTPEIPGWENGQADTLEEEFTYQQEVSPF